ncbi:sensor histidine kinase [Mycolicibacterium madagascariense]|uniref:sensor histidine kinase n=1 Tax=Mycolicibacterium madagascariense TaxID=212765 RepID=UPI0013D1E70F|nr:ATP-binding protein [Mycolicibacterium madagascariense]MCV7011642.1 ATP-binding protein [Mycolicibacterium madagascariense]
MSRAANIGLAMRHTANLLVAVVALADPDSAARLPGQLLLIALGLWAIHRLATRSHSSLATAIDVAFTVAVCLGIPLLVADPRFYLSNCAPIAVAGTAVIGFTVGLPIRVSIVVASIIAASYATGAAAVIGWPHVHEVFNLYYFGLQWATCALIRLAELRVALAVDAARARRQHADVTQRVAEAVRDYDREQLRLLHDTVASTLLLVGQGSPLSPERLARQARRDLEMLGDPQPESSEPMNVVAALRDLSPQYATPMRCTGVESLWVDAEIGHCVVAVIREALNNVDRHARAGIVTLDVVPHRIVITDDGRGFDPTAAAPGYGISHSMTARMHTIGGSTAVTSSVGHGTTVTLTWPNPEEPRRLTDAVGDPDRLIERTRTGYALALTAYAVLSLASMAPPSLSATAHPGWQLTLAASAAVITLSAIGFTLRKRSSPALLPGALVVIALAQTVLLPPTVLGGQAQWSQAAIGWCVLPFVLRYPVRHAAAWLVSVWVIVGAYTFLRSPSAHTAVNLGLGTASILAVQLFALLFSGLVADAAADAHDELTAQTELVARQHITSALRIEYRRRYANLLANVRPLLEAWRERTPVDPAMRHRAQVESRRLRVLFSQSAVFDHPLLAQLRSAIDAADQRGIDVSVDVQGALPSVTEADARDIAAPLGAALAVTRSSARVTVLALDDVVLASIVCDHVEDADVSALQTSTSDDVDVVGAGETVWVTVRHRLRGGETRPDDHTRSAEAVDLHHR